METKELEITWRPEIDNWQHTSKDLAEFFFSQAEKLLKETIEISDSITTKAYNIILVLIPLVSVLAGFIVGYQDQSGNQVLVILATACLIGFLYSLFEALRVFMPKTIVFLGSQPKKLVNPAYIISSESKDIQIIEVLYSECANLQAAIEANDESNNKRLSRIKRAIIASIVSPILSLLIFCLVAFTF